MPYVLVEDFKGGIDTRRTVVTSVPGTAVTLTNAHVTRGGEIEKRRAFKLWATLPANTHGLAAGGGRVPVIVPVFRASASARVDPGPFRKALARSSLAAGAAFGAYWSSLAAVTLGGS